MREVDPNPPYKPALPLPLHCLFALLPLGTDPKIDPSEKKLLLVESMRFRILEIDLQRLLPQEPAHGNPPPSLAAGLAFCGVECRDGL